MAILMICVSISLSYFLVVLFQDPIRNKSCIAQRIFDRPIEETPKAKLANNP